MVGGKIPIRERLEKVEIRVTPKQRDKLKKKSSKLAITTTTYIKLKAMDLLKDNL